MLVIGSVFLFLFGLFMLIKPDVVHQLTENWKSESMSEWSIRLIGGAFTVFGIVGFVAACMS